MFKLNLGDFGKGVVTAVYAGAALAILSVLQGVFGAPGFDVFSVDWVAAGHAALNAAIVGAQAGFTGYIIKNFFSDEEGKAVTPLGRIG